MPLTRLDVAVCFLALLITRWISGRRQRHSSLPLPPGPRGLPIIGNLRDVPTKHSWLTFQQWRYKYDSDLVRFNLLGSEFVVVNSLKVAIDLFDRRSRIYNDRSNYVFSVDLCGMGWLITFIPYGNFWKDTRRAFHRGLGTDAVKDYIDVEVSAARNLLVRLHKSPEHFMEHLRHMAGRIIMRSAYGIKVQDDDDPYVDIAERGIQALNEGMNAGSFLVDSIPILRYIPEWFPGAHFKRFAKELRIPVTGMLEKPYGYFKKQMESGADLPQCAASTLHENMMSKAEDPEYTESFIKASLASMYTGGADTTVSTLGTFVLAMVLNPEVQAKAHAELDRVIGTGRLPEVSDKPSLPYVDAIVRETLRWHPVVPVNVPHRLIQDDEYEGYFLPEGTSLIVNIWGILHDPEAYPDPMAFKPDRFLKDGVIDPSVQDPMLACFGFGRRICPGRWLAKESVWITISTLLAAYRFDNAIGPDGRKIVPEEVYSSGVISYPQSFKCEIRPRSAECEALILAIANEK